MKAIEITCPAGTFIGTRLPASVRAFRGIPYAELPVGDNRWRAPVKKGSSSTPVEALKFGPPPVQVEPPPSKYRINAFALPKVSEDCLYLNIWTTGTEPHRKPVLVWIYGGAYIQGYSGSPHNDGAALVQAHPEIVFVSMDYRLGLLGSLNLSSLDRDGEYAHSNNLNLLDQRMALQWVRENISAFGGDPDNVTLWGHSAGSNAITHHLTSMESRKYFHKAICESSFFTGFGTTSLQDSKTIGDWVAENANAHTVSDLQKLRASDILTIQGALLKEPLPGLESKLFSPVSDGGVLPVDPKRGIEAGGAASIPVMIGVSAGEYDQMFLDLETDEEVLQAVLKRLPPRIRPDRAWIDRFVSGDPARSRRHAYMDMYNQVYLLYAASELADLICTHGECYCYQFKWWEDQYHRRAPHGANNAFVLGNHLPHNKPDTLCMQIQSTWVSFMKTGNPNNALIPNWDRYDLRSRTAMMIDRRWASACDPFQKDRKMIELLLCTD